MIERVLPRLRRRREDAPVNRLSQEIVAAEQGLSTATPDTRATLYNRLGDLSVKAGQKQRALFYYGRSIDAYLEIGHFDPAAALCRKVIRLEPAVVRARCTLALLSLGKGMLRDAEQELKSYVRAAERAGQEGLASERLRLVAEAAQDHEIRLKIREHLLNLGDERGADEVLRAVFAEGEREEGEPGDAGVRWERLLRAAVQNVADA